MDLTHSIESVERQLAAMKELNKSMAAKPAANPQHQQLIDLYEEFIKTDDGEFLEIGLQKFVEFVQSRQT